MKIGILTFHRSINNGAVMQCYALCKRLQEELPQAVVEVIDYHMPKVNASYEASLKNYLRGSSLKGKIKLLLKLIMQPNTLCSQAVRKRVFENSMDMLPLSKEKIFDDGVDQLFEYINQNYDIVISGSDAIWNYRFRGFPNPYFLSDKITIPKFSYAASCNGMNYEQIPAEQKEQIQKILNSYQFLGVRDNEAANFARSIGCTSNVSHTCDPTVFLDVNKLPVDENQLKSKLKKKGFSFEQEAIAVMGTNAMCKMVRSMYGNRYQIVSLYNYCKDADLNLYDLTPYEWAYIFRFFKLTFTTYFHGTLLSLKNGVPVICIAAENAYSKAHVTKVEDVLQRLDLEDCYIHTNCHDCHVDTVKTKADELLINNRREQIFTALNREAQTSSAFFSLLHEISRKDHTA